MLREWTYTASSRDALGNTSPSALEISPGLRPREISRASGCKIHALGKSLGPRGMYFPMHPSSRQCTDTIHPSSRQCTYTIILWCESEDKWEPESLARNITLSSFDNISTNLDSKNLSPTEMFPKCLCTFPAGLLMAGESLTTGGR